MFWASTHPRPARWQPTSTRCRPCSNATSSRLDGSAATQSGQSRARCSAPGTHSAKRTSTSRCKSLAASTLSSSMGPINGTLFCCLAHTHNTKLKTCILIQCAAGSTMVERDLCVWCAASPPSLHCQHSWPKAPAHLFEPRR